MAVGFSKTNKPLNPRGNDQSPKGYNRAALYSGKALDFDGANDNISFPLFTFSTGNKYTLCIYANRDNNGMIWSRDNQWIEVRFTSGALELRTYNNGLAAWSTYTLIDDVPANEWHQIIVTYDVDANLWKSYLNGQFIKSVTAEEPSNKHINRIGSSASTFYDGEFANAKIFEVELTAAQVADLYNNPEKIVPTGVADSALKLWLPMMEGAGTTAYNGAPDALGSNVVTNGTFDTDSDWTKDTGWTIGSGKATRSGASTNSYISQDFDVVSGTTYMLKYDRTYISGGGETNCFSYFEGNVSRSTRGIYSSLVQETVTVVDTFTPTHSGNLAFRLYGIGTFEGSIDNIEIKPISGIGTISGATWTHGIGAPVAQTAVIDWNKIQARTNGGSLNEVLIPQGLTAGRDLLGNLFENVRKQGALNLDGNSWAEVHDNASLDITGDFSLEGWIYFDADVSYRGSLVSKYKFTQSSRAYALERSGININVTVSSDGSATAALSSSNITTTGWMHCVATYDGSFLRLYINGAVDGYSAYTSGVYAHGYPVTLGVLDTASQATSIMKDQIAQPRIYNRALTAEEVLQNYNSGKSIYQ